jgi:hypothetical protein
VLRDRLIGRRLSGAALTALCLVIGACASSVDTTPDPNKKLSDVFATPDWAKFTGATATSQRAVTPDDLISADGRCAGSPGPVASASSDTTDGTNPGGPEAPPVPAPQAPTVGGGIALAMTECQVAQRAGSPERLDIGADGQDRSVTLTYMRGPWPGIYRFRGGRLVSIDRVEVPPEPKSKKQPAKKKQQSRG